MGKAIYHAKSSAKKFGGKPEDYMDIHEYMDASRIQFGDVRHRCITHTSWFITEVLPMKFGQLRKNSEGSEYSVMDVAEQHVLEDFGGLFIPTLADFISEMSLTAWMNNAQDGAVPPSRSKFSEDSSHLDLANSGILDGVSNEAFRTPIRKLRTTPRRPFMGKID